MMGVFVQLNTTSPRAASQPVGYVIQENGCWEWVGALDRGGYGRMNVGGAAHLAHRFLYEQANGPIPTDAQCDHLCRQRSCVNPDHIEVVSQRENLLRGEGWAGLNAAKTTCPRGHPLVGENLKAWELEHRGWRICRTCYSDWKRAHRKQPAEANP